MPDKAPPGRRRRRARRIVVLGLLLAPVLLAGWSVFIEPDMLVVRERTVATGRWPRGYPPLRIAVLADLHVGAPRIGLEKVDEIVARTNALQPDVIVLLGDFVAHGVIGGRPLAIAESAPRLALLRARHGVFAVLGNHDWWQDGPGVTALLQQAGIRVLEEESVHISAPAGWWLYGAADDTTRAPDPTGTVSSIPLPDPVIAIAHDPAAFIDMPDRVALTLAAHMHGGQVYLPWIGALITPGRAPRAWAFGHVQDGGRDLVVTAGIGTSILPIRFNMPPEILLVTLTAP